MINTKGIHDRVRICYCRHHYLCIVLYCILFCLPSYYLSVLSISNAIAVEYIGRYTVCCTIQLRRVIQSGYEQIGAGDSTTAVVRLLYEYDGYDFFVVGIHTMNYGCIFVCCDAGTLRI